MTKDFMAPNRVFASQITTKLIFGAGALQKLHEENLPYKKAMICVTPEPFYKDLGYLDAIETELKLKGIEWIYFDKVRPNPLTETVDDGAEIARKEGVDLVISFGGGSCHDTAKGIAAVAANDGKAWDFVNGGTGGGKPLANEPLAVIAITTTAGTGSETDSGGVLNNPITNEKLAITAAPLIPKICIADINLMTSVPPKATAMQGFDAFCHNLEAYISTTATLQSDMESLTGIRYAARYLPRAVKNGNDMEAREYVAFSAHLGGRDIMNAGCCGMHGCEHALSAYYDQIPHGVGLAMTAMAYYKKAVAKHVIDERFIRVAQAMGIEDATKPEDFLTALQQLLEGIGLDDLKMSDYGVKYEDAAMFAEKAHVTLDRLLQKDAAKLTLDEIVEVFQESYK